MNTMNLINDIEFMNSYSEKTPNTKGKKSLAKALKKPLKRRKK